MTTQRLEIKPDGSAPSGATVLDAHAPEAPVHGWRSFFRHVFTTTIGLLMALGLENAVEWQHHRNLVNDAETSLRGEIAGNAREMPRLLADLEQEQASLKQDVHILKIVIATGKLPKGSTFDISAGIRMFDNVSWKTAQSTGALSYMPYDQAKVYSSIYATQDLLAATEQQAARDATVSLGPFLNPQDDDVDPSANQADAIKQKIEILQGQLLLVNSLMRNLDGEYKDFLSHHSQ